MALQTGKAAALNRAQFGIAFSGNPHGFGLAYASKKGLIIRKPFLEEQGAWEAYQKALRTPRIGPLLIHFRFTTSGKGPENTHPHAIADARVALAHNGILPAHATNKDESDTVFWCKTVFWNRSPRELLSERFRKHIENYMGGSKIVLLDDTGGWSILNESFGHWKSHNWYSNFGYESCTGRVLHLAKRVYTHDSDYEWENSWTPPSKASDVFTADEEVEVRRLRAMVEKQSGLWKRGRRAP